MIDLRCEACSVHLRVADELGGKKARCPKCREVIRIPEPGAAHEEIPGVLFCDGCGGSIAGTEVRCERGGKTLCSYCIAAEEAVRPLSEDQMILEEAGLDIPGAVVLKSREERTFGRIAQDSAARRSYERSVAKRAAGDAEAVIEAFLVDRGFVDQETIDKVKLFRDRGGKSLIWALDSLEVMSEAELAWRLAEAQGFPHTLEEVLPVEAEVRGLLPVETVSARKVLPLRQEGNEMEVALVNPLDPGILREVEALAGMTLRPIVCTETCFTNTFDQAYRK